MVRKETLDGVSVWVLTAERPLEGFEGTDLSTLIEPLQTHRWVVDPETSRALRWESSSDFGTVTYPDADIDLGPQRIAFAWTFYDYDVDIVIRAPLVGGGAPPPTPLPTHTPTP
jgi:hypothetical protein